MSTNNRQRREAKRRKRERGNARRRSAERPGQPPPAAGSADRARVSDTLRGLIAGRGLDPDADRDGLERLLDAPAGKDFVAQEMDSLLQGLVVAVLAGGWTPADLGEVTRRRLTPHHVPALAATLRLEADRHPPGQVAEAWISDLDRLGPAEPGDPRTVHGLEVVIALAALMAGLPAISEILAPPGQSNRSVRRTASDVQGRRLATVRALLAKAESTQFAEEAELLSAKAQELISRHALDRLVDTGADEDEQPAITARRIWLEGPYVLAKAMVVDAVAGANRCRAVISQGLGFCTIIGDEDDLDAVELLATSLLVQANVALLAHGRPADGGGGSRTKSFRRSFLIAYATRIGERLRSATNHVAATAGSGELVPLLARRQRRVDETWQQMFPHLVPKDVTISNGAGWFAGLAAADLARLDTTPEVGDGVRSTRRSGARRARSA